MLKEITCCPYCLSDLEWLDNVHCPSCLTDYPIIENRQIDLRLQKQKEILVKQKINVVKNSFHSDEISGPSSFNFGFEKNKDGYKFIDKLNLKPVNKLYSYLPKSGGIALDIGSSKDNYNRQYLEKANFRYISADYDSPTSKLLVDAHSLPFKNKSIDCITNLAVMEHIEFPHIAGREFYRVLKTGGMMLGVVAFLQQQHLSSWYHFTHYGTYSWLVNSGFDIDNIKIDAAGKKYHGIYTTASLIGLPKLIKNLVLSPIYYLHRFLWLLYKLKSNEDGLEKRRHFQTTGAINFIAKK